jgi:undecaprenyl-diphosphatase
MLAVTIKLFISSSDRDYFMQHMPGLVFGNLVAFIAGMIAIKFLLGYLANHSLAVFGWYRVGLASVLTLILLLQWS